MDTIQITLPDGSTRQVPRGTTPSEIARQISPRWQTVAMPAERFRELAQPFETLL